MDELTEEQLRKQARELNQNVLRRFRKLFGREMTASERKNFLLPQKDTVSVEED